MKHYHSVKLGRVALAVLASIFAGSGCSTVPTRVENNYAVAAHGTPADSGPCKMSIAECTPDGCATPGSAHALQNRAKRSTVDLAGHVPSFGNALLLNFGDFHRLQLAADAHVAQGADIADRTVVQGLLATGPSSSPWPVGEGSAVRIVGYIVGLAPHADSIESVNCRLRRTVNQDIHINLAAAPQLPDTSGIVVEVIPQGRSAAMTPSALEALRGKQLMVVGRLFYDNEHRVNTDHHPGDPARMSVFEIHPVTEIFVCALASGCDPERRADWGPVP